MAEHSGKRGHHDSANGLTQNGGATALHTAGTAAPPGIPATNDRSFGYPWQPETLEKFRRRPKPGKAPAGQQRTPAAPASNAPDEKPVPLEHPEFDDDGEAVEVLSPFDGLSDDIVADYLKRIGSFPLLTASEEVDLAQAIEAGLLAEHKIAGRLMESRRELHDHEAVARAGSAAMETFMNSNLRLVVSIAKRHCGRGMEFIDLIAEGNQGLLRAVQKFDFTKGFKFSTYATWWIRQAVARALADQGRSIRLPVHLAEQVNKLHGVETKLAAALDRGPTAEELATTLGVDVAMVAKLKRVSRPVFSLDLEVPDGRGGTEPLGEQLSDPDEPSPCDALEFRARASAIQSVLDTLSEREAGVVSMRFGLADGQAKTLEEIGLVYGVTRERIRQIESRTLTKLRHPTRSLQLRAFHDAPIENDECLTKEEKAANADAPPRRSEGSSPLDAGLGAATPLHGT
ncbi:sigma-70 family RNA polymerase sigma factor [Arthrobacter livingstonensis]|nr:sigma-70 family RNA polymerase sigma factor [Arthrobacter livingstonensis]